MQGRHDDLSANLDERMRKASREMDFELAALLRDQLKAIDALREAQRVVSVSDADQDVVGLYRQGERVELVVMRVRSGRVVDVSALSLLRVDVDDSEVISAFLREHYVAGQLTELRLPDENLVPALPDGAEGISEWLSDLQKDSSERHRCRVLMPTRGPKRHLLDLARENAQHAFEEKQRAAEDVQVRLARLQRKLRLPKLPSRIECVDISHLGGNDTVGAVVALHDGAPDKSRYRTYHVKTVEGGDDYGALLEVLRRRFRRGAEDPGQGETEVWELPDLFVIDGGRGQLAVALTAAGDLGITDLPIVGLAKEKENAHGEKLVDRGDRPGQKTAIALRPGSPELYFLARVRDEAHRFANRGRSKLGRTRRFASLLDSVKGVGPKTRKALYGAYPSLEAMRDASDEELARVPGVTPRVIEGLRALFAEIEGEAAGAEGEGAEDDVAGAEGELAEDDAAGAEGEGEGSEVTDLAQTAAEQREAAGPEAAVAGGLTEAAGPEAEVAGAEVESTQAEEFASDATCAK